MLQSQTMRVWNRTRGKLLAERAGEACTFAARLRGWLGSAPAAGDGLYLRPCAWVHTLGLRRPLDAVYLDRDGRVLAVRTLAPWRIGPWVRGAAGVLELPAGACARLGCAPGDRLEQDDGRGW